MLKGRSARTFTLQRRGIERFGAEIGEELWLRPLTERK